MTLSMLLAWLAALCAVMAALKYIARISKNPALNRFFHKCHIPFGVLLLVFGLAHGLLAGNPSWATLSDFSLAPVLFTWNWGTACLVLAALLGLTYLLRRTLKRRWMVLHRVLTVLLILVLALHLLNVGIQLPSRLFGSSQSTVAAQTQTASSDTQTAVSADTQTSSAASTDTQTAASSDTQTAAASSDTQAASSSAVTFSGAVLADGVYEGSANGFSGTTTVSVTVSGGQVTDITVVSERDSQQYFSRAESLLDEIVNGQTLEVDAVSGATFSSAGILNATADALQQAVVSGTLQVTSIDLSSIQRHGH